MDSHITIGNYYVIQHDFIADIIDDKSTPSQCIGLALGFAKSEKGATVIIFDLGNDRKRDTQVWGNFIAAISRSSTYSLDNFPSFPAYVDLAQIDNFTLNNNIINPSEDHFIGRGYIFPYNGHIGNFRREALPV